MNEPINQTQLLKVNCQLCGHQLYSYWHTPSSDHPELGNWYVECTNLDCDYKHDDAFIDLEDVYKQFSDKSKDQPMPEPNKVTLTLTLTKNDNGTVNIDTKLDGTGFHYYELIGLVDLLKSELKLKSRIQALSIAAREKDKAGSDE